MINNQVANNVTTNKFPTTMTLLQFQTTHLTKLLHILIYFNINLPQSLQDNI